MILNEYSPRLLERVTAPAIEPVTLSEVKNYIRVDTATDDSLIASLISTAREEVEEYTKKSLINQSWKLTFADNAPWQVFLPKGPVQSVTEVIISDRLGIEEVLDPAIYYLNSTKTCLIFDVLPEGNKIEITYSAGFGANSEDVPVPFRQAILVYVNALYDCREETVMPEKVFALLAPYRALSI